MKIRTIQEAYFGEFKSFQSRFISYLYPTPTLDIQKDYLHQLKKEHPKATHICYAYRIGFQNETTRANDDGEPAGTAGKPILNQLYSFNVQNVSLFVVRYYGGTKLGVPGLIEAYKEAALAALKQAQWIEVEEEIEVAIQVDSPTYYEAIKILKNNKITILDSSFHSDKYHLVLQLPLSKKHLIQDWI